MPETVAGGDDHGQVGEAVVPLRNVPVHRIVVFTPVQGGASVPPVSIIDRIKVKWRHSARIVFQTLVSTQLIVVILYQLTMKSILNLLL